MPKTRKPKRRSFAIVKLVLLVFVVLAGIVLVRRYYTNWSRVLQASTSGLPAFPGAQGFGSTTVGGRGGQVIKVTNLNSSGTGSLKAAMEATGPRIVIFAVSGIIDMGCSPINVIGSSKSFLTVAGQTAPGDGILLKGKIIIRETNNVVIRYMRVRPADPGSPSSESCDGIDIHRNTRDIVLDHNSITWATDENLNLDVGDPEGDGDSIRNVTLSWNIIGEGDADSTHPESNPSIGEHSMGGLIERGTPPDMVENISIHHNLYIHNNKRNFLSSGGASSSTSNSVGVVRFINNVVYNWGRGATMIGALTNQVNRFDIIGNYYRSGPSTLSSYNIPIWCYGSGVSDAGVCRLYLSGNTHQNGITGTPTTADVTLRNGSGSTLTVDRRSSAMVNDNVSVDPAATALSRVAAQGGATLPRRDSVDTRLINELNSGTGRVGIDNDHARRYPTLTSASAPADSDNDGMPNTWEDQYSLNRNSATDANQDPDGDGYHNIEEYINNTIPRSTVHSPTPVPASPTPTPSSSSCPFGPYAVPGRVEAENFTCGGEGVAFHDTTLLNLGLSHRPNNRVDIQGTSDIGGGFNIGWTVSGEWLKYAVNVPQAGLYDAVVRTASVNTTGSFRLKVDGVDVSGVRGVPNTGGNQIWTNVTVPNISLTSGAHTIELSITGSGPNYNYIDFIARPNIELEAESGNLVGSMVSVSDTTASGGRYINSTQTNYTYTASPGSATLNINVPVSGTYYVWLKGKAANGNNDSLFLSFDNFFTFQVADVAISGNWTWQRAFSIGVSLTPGSHQLRISAREANAKVDKILLTRDAGFVPQ